MRHFPSDLPLLGQAIEDVQPQLVIIDPIASYIDAGLDMGKNNELRLILQPPITLTERHTATKLSCGLQMAMISSRNTGSPRSQEVMNA